MNPESQPGESAQGEFRLADELCKVISKAQWLYIKQPFGKSVQKINPSPRKTNKQTNKQTNKRAKRNEIGTSTNGIPLKSRNCFFFRVDLQLRLKLQHGDDYIFI